MFLELTDKNNLKRLIALEDVKQFKQDPDGPVCIEFKDGEFFEPSEAYENIRRMLRFFVKVFNAEECKELEVKFKQEIEETTRNITVLPPRGTIQPNVIATEKKQ